MMALSPGYGETPLPHHELDALLPAIVEVLDSPITRRLAAKDGGHAIAAVQRRFCLSSCAVRSPESPAKRPG